MKRTITVLVADSERLFSDALGGALQQYADIEVVGAEVTDGIALREAVTRFLPSVVLLDYFLPEMDGPTATRAIQSLADETKVLLLSWTVGLEMVQESLVAGAVGFLPKSLTVDQVVQAIRRAEAGQSLVYGDELAKLLEDIRRRESEAENHAASLMTLTPRELQILQRFSEGRGFKELASELQIAAGTLKNYVHAILTKTGARTRVEAVEMARKAGVVRDGGPNEPPLSH